MVIFSFLFFLPSEHSVQCLSSEGSNSYVFLDLYYYYYYYYYSLQVFASALADGLSRESGWQSLQVSRNLLSILADLYNTVLWMVSICPLISNFSRTLFTLLEIIPSVPITTGIIITLMFSRLFFLVFWQGPSSRLSFRFHLCSLFCCCCCSISKSRIIIIQR